ncbi:type IV pilus assembly protein PilM [Pullulanibacillus pueri]|uniref:Type IV pilus assembly protein PilM n=1 Tax=Pullulanibacillus pueri TaxID=1437324 RepID=A0A8J2ZZF2_9BACL|nr:pilus assembly protein PilM [Pullulanibacillus pueri]MBM7680505.1 type IV pilus assembly protein PilM [Pullulanibacillus pueri]GGH86055.1 hypothetical protein GCM10007096_32870 [Pullulanibacillus pueri]
MALSILQSQARYSLVIKDHIIRFVELRKNTLKGIRTMHERRLPNGIIENGNIVDKTRLEDILKHFIKKRKLKGKKIFIIVPDAFVVVRKIEIPGHLSADDIRSYLFMEIGHSIHLPFNNPVFDVHVLGQEEEHTEILLFAAPEETVKEYVDLLESCGTKPVAAEISSLSLYRLYKQLDLAMDESSMFIQYDTDGINVSIFKAHLPLFIRQIPKDTKEPTMEMRDSYTEILAEIERMMNFYQFTLNNGEDAVQKVILTGDNPAIEAFFAHLKTVLTLPIYPLFNQHLQGISGRSIPSQYHVNIGLALKEVPSQ